MSKVTPVSSRILVFWKKKVLKAHGFLPDVAQNVSRSVLQVWWFRAPTASIRTWRRRSAWRWCVSSGALCSPRNCWWLDPAVNVGPTVNVCVCVCFCVFFIRFYLRGLRRTTRWKWSTTSLGSFCDFYTCFLLTAPFLHTLYKNWSQGYFVSQAGELKCDEVKALVRKEKQGCLNTYD